jgi:hypothetical protein
MRPIREPVWRVQRCGADRQQSKETRDGASLMKPLTAAIIGALIVAVIVLGYLYYQRTNNDITIRVPKIEIKP